MNATVTLPPTKQYPHKRQWPLQRLWEKSKNLEITQIEVDLLWDERYAEAWCWQHDNEKLNNEFFLHHMKRVLKADLDYPIILSEERYIFDGVHRLVKAKQLNLKYITCVQFQKDPTDYI